MAQSGTLGSYLFGHSPFDAALLKQLRMTTAEFAAVVAASASDGEVLEALRGRGFDEAAVRRWSARLPRSARFYTYLWDVDDGYIRPNVVVRWCLVVWRAVFERPAMGLLRRLFTAP